MIRKISTIYLIEFRVCKVFENIMQLRKSCSLRIKRYLLTTILRVAKISFI